MKRAAVKKTTIASKYRTSRECHKKSATDSSSDNITDYDYLTPHIHRLLKLIRSGNHQQAAKATDLLREQVEHAANELLVWDVLGRLQESLTSALHQTRQQGSVALQAVASLLPLPNVQEFYLSITGHQQQESTKLFITIGDLQKDLDQILQHGQVLLARSCDIYDSSVQRYSDQAELQKLDNQAINTPNDDFVNQRVRLQRQILVRRLGFGTIGSAIGIDQVVPDNLTSIDFQDDTYSDKKPRKRSKKQRNNDKNDENQNIESNLLRTLMLCQARTKVLNNVVDSEESNSQLLSLQLLLANELMYTMFDPIWQRRHGAILGILALWKAWNTDKDSLWWEDLLCKSLILLALDRLGDFSGSWSDTAAVVAPVRTAASQLVAVLWIKASPKVKSAVLDVLERLLQHEDDWEVRHGALLACKFILASCNESQADPDACLESTVSRLSQLALHNLNDNSDDVKSVAVQIAHQIVERRGVITNEFNVVVTPLLWNLLQRARSLSSYLPDTLLALTAVLGVDHDSLQLANITQFDIFCTVTKFLSSDFVSVRFYAIRCLGQLSRHYSTYVTSQPESTAIHNRSIANAMEQFFSLFSFCPPIESAANDILQQFTISRSTTWSILCSSISSSSLADREMLFITLFYACCGIDEPRVVSFAKLKLMTSAVAEYVACTKLYDSSVLQAVLTAFLQSPVIRHYEAVCLLVDQMKALDCDMSKIDSVASILCNYVNSEISICLQFISPDETSRATSVYCQTMQDWKTKVQSQENADYTTLQEAFSSVKESLSLESSPTRSKTLDVLQYIRLLALTAGSALQFELPMKVSPFIRPLFDSLQNDSCCDRLAHTELSIIGLLSLLRIDDGNKRTYGKVCNKVCSILVSDAEKESSFSISCKIIEKITSRYITLTEFKDDEEYLWSQIGGLCNSNEFTEEGRQNLYILKAVCTGIQKDRDIAVSFIDNFTANIIRFALDEADDSIYRTLLDTIRSLINLRATHAFSLVFECVEPQLDSQGVAECRKKAIEILDVLCKCLGDDLCQFVRQALPLVMPLMTDPDEESSALARSIFSVLVCAAPLTTNESSHTIRSSSKTSSISDQVLDHLIVGLPLPPYELPEKIKNELVGITLRSYQLEGVSWLAFLRNVKLNGALCDDMGLGKTLQALISIALAHTADDDATINSKRFSIVVCPSSLVGHWYSEVVKFFPNKTILQPLQYTGPASVRGKLWERVGQSANLVLTSYNVLRSDSHILNEHTWCYCVLDEGHLMKNPATATAKAAKSLRTRHRLIISGTPIENHVNELWATFDFLMPNFLGDQSYFHTNYARPITSSYKPDASAEVLEAGIDKLRHLHQQVLPFILRREKESVLKELPPKNVIRLLVPMSTLQSQLYNRFCSNEKVKITIDALRVGTEDALDAKQAEPHTGSFKSLILLRLLCTHPSLIYKRLKATSTNNSVYRLDSSGKFIALFDILCQIGLIPSSIHSMDGDYSGIYNDELDSSFDTTYSSMLASEENQSRRVKCLVFSQYKESLDLVEKLILDARFPTVKYMRMDGDTPPEYRADMAAKFNSDPSICVFLLTTRVGGLGLNLTGADNVIFLESDYNPFADIQAMDRAHRIGQSKTVNVYRLVLQDTIEESIMNLQQRKLQTSNAIVNSDNSTMFSMGTDKLLDIFTPSNGEKSRNGTNSSYISDTDMNEILESFGKEYVDYEVNRFVQNYRI